MTKATQLASSIRLAAFDVDGVMTDGSLYYGDHEIKAFNIKDGLGLKLLAKANIQCAIITGRSSPMVEQRARELGITLLMQNREDKLDALKELCQRQQVNLTECAYMGDDLPDLSAIRAAGLGASPADAHPLVKQAADWVSQYTGGRGAVREFCEFLLTAQNQYEKIISLYDQ